MSSPIFAALVEARQMDTERRVHRPPFEYPPRPRRGLSVAVRAATTRIVRRQAPSAPARNA